MSSLSGARRQIARHEGHDWPEVSKRRKYRLEIAERNGSGVHRVASIRREGAKRPKKRGA